MLSTKQIQSQTTPIHSLWTITMIQTVKYNKNDRIP